LYHECLRFLDLWTLYTILPCGYGNLWIGFIFIPFIFLVFGPLDFHDVWVWTFTPGVSINNLGHSKLSIFDVATVMYTIWYWCKHATSATTTASTMLTSFRPLDFWYICWLFTALQLLNHVVCSLNHWRVLFFLFREKSITCQEWNYSKKYARKNAPLRKLLLRQSEMIHCNISRRLSVSAFWKRAKCTHWKLTILQGLNLTMSSLFFKVQQWDEGLVLSTSLY